MKRSTIYGMIGGLAAILLMIGALFLVSTSFSGEEKDANSDYEKSRSLEESEEVNNEESGDEFTKSETYDRVRKAVRLIISYNGQSNSFIGTVENTEKETLKQVRVEVHLSNEIELGPTTPVDLRPGEKRNVELTATSRSFNKWSAHAEVGASEHGLEDLNGAEESEEVNHEDSGNEESHGAE